MMKRIPLCSLRVSPESLDHTCIPHKDPPVHHPNLTHSRIQTFSALLTRWRRTDLVQRVGDALIGWLTRGSEPVISERWDGNGDRYYRVYDPLTENLHCFTTEHDVRIWLEQRYSH